MAMHNQRQIIEHITTAIHSAPHYEQPFYHLQLANVFPEDTYAKMLQAMPVASDYRPMSGRTKYTRTDDGSGTRVKIDLFPEYIRHLPGNKQTIWQYVGDALCSASVRDAFRDRLAPGLEDRFSEEFKTVGMFPIPVLTRDTTGYYIPIHPDTHRKGITVQLYLPRDASIEHVGTIFHKRTDNDTFEKSLQMPFSPNTGYAFAVGENTYHSVEEVGPEVNTRDSILLTYFVDRTVAQIVLNRAKRFFNLLRNEVRQQAAAG